MFHFFRYRNLLHFNNIQVRRIRSLQNPFRECHSETSPPSSFIEYLQGSLGFSQERALTISKQLKRDIKKPDIIPTFLKSQGFSKTQIKSIINRHPTILHYSSPESRLTPKIQFFKEKGFSESDVMGLMVSNPGLFAQSLERSIKPLFDLTRGILGRDDFVVELLRRPVLGYNLDCWVTNVNILRSCGISGHRILKLLRRHPRMFGTGPDKFNEIVEMVKEMGFKPFLNSFAEAIITMAGLSPLSWNKKFKVYSSVGWSNEEILSAFRKNPSFMRLSEEKIKKGMDYFTKDMGWDPSHISMHPTLLCLSLEKRIMPRHRFLQFLASKGFINEDKIFLSSFLITEQQFFNRYVMRYQSGAPDILKIYEGLVGSRGLNAKR